MLFRDTGEERIPGKIWWLRVSPVIGKKAAGLWMKQRCVCKKNLMNRHIPPSIFLAIIWANIQSGASIWRVGNFCGNSFGVRRKHYMSHLKKAAETSAAFFVCQRKESTSTFPSLPFFRR
jgi:hypothetical protein